MKKLLVAVLALFVFSVIYAGSATPQVSWTGSAYFSLGIDEKGVDIDGGLSSFTLSVSPTGSTEAGVSFWFDFIAGTWGFNSLTFENDYFGLTYAEGAVGFNKFFGGLTDTNGDYVPDTPVLDGIAEDNIDVNVKVVDGLEIVFMDLVSGEVDYDTGDATGHVWFDDFLGVKYSIAGVNLAAAIYDTDTDPSTSTLEFGVTADKNLEFDFGSVALEAVVASAASPVYGLSEAFNGTFGIVSLTQNFKWFENVNLLTYKGDDAPTGKAFDVTAAVDYGVTDNVSVNGSLGFVIADLTTPSNFTVPVTLGADFASAFTAGVSLSWADVLGAATAITASVNAGYEADMFNLGLTAKWADLVGAPSAIELNLTAGVTVDMVTGSVGLYWADLSDATNVVADISVKVVPLDALTLTAAAKYAGGVFGYNAGLTCVIDDNTTFNAFYGTLYDKDGDGVIDINDTDAQWYLKLEWSTSF
ncbi:hypothetical protein [Thermosipho atlanticus]|uniref:EF-hand domain-containing protein n=1 Tax=Thermosipho atlanticus DSM 15807 TaxID=1123380 RepID=A0A1M5RYJ7_9BACT|nr:hypothetical protein [Thermosipho atlanticus]SHH31316.1 hypothetical protein SAMN02745199_0699 [Thermosipho atlanticus DSM 15807]